MILIDDDPSRLVVSNLDEKREGKIEVHARDSEDPRVACHSSLARRVCFTRSILLLRN